MELKYITLGNTVKTVTCSNRTFMELKFMLCVLMKFLRLVLIAPLWN